MASVLIAEDNEGLRKAICEALQREEFEVEATADGEEAMAVLRRRHFDLLVSDVKMPGVDGIELLRRVKQTDPDTSVILMTAYGTVDMAVDAMKAGAFDFLTKPFSVDSLVITVRKALERHRLIRENLSLKQSLSVYYDPAKMLWKSRRMGEVVELIKKVAPTNSTVLIEGDSGTGKELIAHAIHALSPRVNHSLVKVNISVFGEGVLESELFGHEKGAFTGAHARKPGRFEMADGGSLFLDEIGDLSLGVQVKLLRVLQEREFERVGGTVPLKVDVRVIAATRRNLRDLARAGKFREDLFFRLNVVTIKVPLLRERVEDVGLLAQHFVDRYRMDARKEISGISPEAIGMLEAYNWPGNVRELENVIQRALVLAEGSRIEVDDLPADIRLGSAGRAESAKAREDAEKADIVKALEQDDGNRSRAAARLGLNRTTLLYKMKKYGLVNWGQEYK